MAKGPPPPKPKPAPMPGSGDSRYAMLCKECGRDLRIGRRAPWYARIRMALGAIFTI